MNSIGVGLVGLGQRGEFHAFSIASTPGLALKAIVSENNKSGRDFALRHDVPKVYSDIEYLLDDKDVDIVVISTPTPTHLYYSQEVVKSGRSLIVESPLERSSEKAKRLYEMSMDEGVYLFTPSLFESEINHNSYSRFDGLWSIPFPYERWNKNWRENAPERVKSILDSAVEVFDVLLSIFNKLDVIDIKQDENNLIIAFSQGKLKIENGSKGLILRFDEDTFSNGKFINKDETETYSELTLLKKWYLNVWQQMESGVYSDDSVIRAIKSIEIVEKLLMKHYS